MSENGKASFGAPAPELDRVIALAGELGAAPDLQAVMTVAVLRVAEVFPGSRVSVVLFRPGDEHAYVVAEHANQSLDNIVVRLSDYPEIRETIRTRQPLLIADVSADALLAGVLPKLTATGAVHRSSVLFPLLRGADVIGVLFIRTAHAVTGPEATLWTAGRLIAGLTALAIGNALDQDVLRREQRALKRNQARTDRIVEDLRQFTDFFARAHDGFVVTDAGGVVRYANPAAAKILGRELAVLEGRKLVDLLSPRSRALADRAWRGDDVGDSRGYVDLLVQREGDVRETVISAGMRTLEASPGVLVSFRDVTEVREIEAELRQTKDFLENLIQSSVDAIVAAETDGTIILFNRAAEQILGYSASDVVHRARWGDFFRTGEADDVMQRLRSEAHGGVGRLELVRVELRTKSGELVPVQLSAAMIYERGREAAMVGIFTDLRERLRMEEKLSQVQRQLHQSERQSVAIELAGAAAHELNQPLTSIVGYAELIRARLPAVDPNRKAIETICRESERMAGMVRRIGELTQYKTRPYVGGSRIVDLSATEAPGAPVPVLIGDEKK